MSIFKPISQESLDVAHRAMSASISEVSTSENGELSSVDLKSLVSGAALALERKAPFIMHDTFATNANQWLDDNSRQFPIMQGAVARLVDDVNTPGKVADLKTETLLKRVVSNVLLEAEAVRISQAKGSMNPNLDTDLMKKLMAAKERPSLARDYDLIAKGDYTALPLDTQERISKTIDSGSNIPYALTKEIEVISQQIDESKSRVGSNFRESSRRIADFMENENSVPLFNTIGSDDKDIADNISSLSFQPKSAAQIGALSFAMQSIFIRTRDDDVARLAMAQGLADYDRYAGEYKKTPAEVAVAMESYSKILFSKKFAMENSETGINDPSWAMSPAFLKRSDQVEMFKTINEGQNVSPLEALRISVSARDIYDEMQYRGLEIKDRSVTFQNIDRSIVNPDFLRNISLPGDMVRLDPKVEIHDIDHKEYEKQLGSGPLEVSKTVIIGIDLEDGMGGTQKAMKPVYEFKDREGQFSFSKFQHVNGEETVFAVVSMENSQLWMTPVKYENKDYDNPLPAGNARKVEGGIFPDMEHFRRDVFERPVSGEFAIRTSSFGDESGPVKIIENLWMGSASDSELKVAKQAIQEAVTKESDRRQVSPAIAQILSNGMGR